jgi:putative oxidoreductase
LKGWAFGRDDSSAAAGLGETVGGLLTAAGFLNPVGSALILSVMIVATVAVHLPNGFFVTNNGIELTSLYGLTSVLLAASGPGPYSLDVRSSFQVIR